MAFPSDHFSLRLQVVEQPFFIQKLQPNVAIPLSYLQEIQSEHGSGRFLSITRTSEEISIVGEANDGLPVTPEDLKWKCIRIVGPMDFGLTGILNSFTTPLKEAKIPVFAISTWNTDYFLVPASKINDAVGVLKSDGWIFRDL